MLQVPTDSLHKFLAVFGLALVIASVGFIFRELEKSREIEGQLARLYAELSFRDMQAKQPLDRYEEFKKRLFEKVNAGESLTPMERERFKSSVDDLKANTQNYCGTVGDVVPKMKELKTLQKYSAYYFFAAGVLFVVGAIVAVYGFRLWYKDSKAGGNARKARSL
ncbi:MAG: hypothetical protein PHX38_13460 [Sulfuricella sp.]|nr:hypothetical protein [Sulfuricella sp.]